MKHIVLLRLSAIGDLIHCLPVYHSLHLSYPKAKIHWLVDQRFQELLKDLPQIVIHPIDKTSLKSLFQSSFKVRSQLKKQSINAIINLHDSMSANLVSLFLPKPINPKLRIGIAKNECRDWQFLFVSQVAEPLNAKKHAVEKYLNCLKMLSSETELKLNYCFDLAKKPVAKKRKNQILINLSISNHDLERRLSQDLYQKILVHLIEKLKNKNEKYQIILTGMNQADDLARAEQLTKIGKEKFKNGVVKNYVAQTNLKDWINLVTSSSLVISPDSAATHLADAFNIPCLSIYQASNPKRMGPFQNQDFCLDFYQLARKKLLKSTETWYKNIKNPKAQQFIDESQVLKTLGKALKTAKII